MCILRRSDTRYGGNCGTNSKHENNNNNNNDNNHKNTNITAATRSRQQPNYGCCFAISCAEGEANAERVLAVASGRACTPYVLAFRAHPHGTPRQKRGQTKPPARRTEQRASGSSSRGLSRFAGPPSGWALAIAGVGKKNSRDFRLNVFFLSPYAFLFTYTVIKRDRQQIRMFKAFEAATRAASTDR